MTTREVQLEGAPPWGFRMNGGADSGHPLRISRVNPGSKAESKGVREGDLITSINGHSTKCLGNSDSHALLRTVKENLRLGLNEDQNGSPRRRSREMKSSPAASEKDVLSTLVTKENAKPSRSKLRRKRKQRLKALLKEKLLGYRETPGHVITDHPVADGYEPSSSMGGSLGHEEGDDDTSSRKLYDNVVDSEVPGPSSERVAENNMPGSSEQCLGTVAFIRKEISTVSPPEVDPNKHHISANTLSRDQVADGNQEQVSKSPKTVTFFRSAVQHAEVHVWEKRPKSTIDDGYEDDGRRHPSSILLDNVMDSNPGASLDSVAGKNISGGSRENLKTGEAIREEMSTVGPSVVNTCPLDPNNHHIAFTAVEIADPNQEQVSKYSKIVTFVPQQVQHAQVHVSEKRPESTSFDNGYDDDSPSLVGENIAPISKLQNKTHNNIPKAVEVITYSAEDGLPSEDYVVQDEDGVKEESKQFFPSNDLVEVLSSTTDDENVYELVVSDIHDPLIVPEEEAQLRTYLGTLSLHEPACVSTEEVRVGPPTEIPAYFLPPKRYLDVISEENSDLSDGDRPWENSEKIKLANAIDTIPEDWFGSQDGIDTSWRDGKSLEDMSDILVVTDSHSDSELTIENSIQNSKQPAVIVLDDTIPRNSKQGLIRLGIETNSENKYRNSGGGNQVTSRGDIVKNVVSSFYTPKKTLQPLQIETIKNSGTVEGPNSEVVEIVYLDSSDSEAISSSRSETNLATTPVPQELLSTSPVHQFSVTSSVSKSAVLPTVNTDVVEIVCINSGDDEAVSAKIGNDVEINSPPGGTLVSNNSSPSADQPSSSQSSSSSHVTQIAADVTHIAADRNRNEPTVQKDMVKISEMISDITHSANEIISTSTEHLARLTCTSPPTYKSKNTNVTARMILRERCSSLPLLDEDSKSGIKSTRSVCSDTGNESDYPHFICNDDSDVSSQTTRLVDPMVATLKELSMGAVLRLPFGISFLKQLGFDQSEYDSYSGYMPEGSEYSFSSKHQFSEREYILADDTENEDESISGGLPQTTSPSRSSQSEKWIGVQIPKDTKLLLAVSPNASKTIKCSHPNIVDLLDLHQKFIERRGYHESEDKFPATMYDQHVNVRHDEDTGEDFSEFRALQEYHALRQKKMREAAQEKMKTPFSEEIIDNVKKNSNFNDSSSRAATRLDDGNSVRTDKNTLHNVSPITVVEEGAVSKIKKDRSSEHAEVSAGEGSEGSEVGNSRLLELIQREEFKGSCDELNMTTATFPCWILLDKQSVSQCESVGKGVDNGSEDGEEAASSVGEGKSEENDFRSRFAVNKLHVSSVDAKGLQRERPKSVPPSGERFRQLMYEEYMNKLAELSQRRRLKAIKLSEPSKSASTPSVSVVEDHLKGEFMDRVRERMTKLGLTDDFVLVDSSILPKPSIDAKTADDQKKLPKHVQELMDIADELDIIGKDGLLVEIDQALSPERKGFLTAKGVWSPAQTPETEKKVPDFPAAEKRERLEDKSEEPAPPVWTPRSAGPSPTLGRKFRPVNFQSPPPQRKEYTSSSDKKPELPKDLPPETSTSVSSNSSSRLISSTSENSTLTHQSTQLRLPSSQNPTITLLQKAREGQIPKGAQYLEDTAPDRPSGITPDEIIYSVKKEYSTADDEGVHKVVELSPKKFSGIGPTTRDGIPVGLRSEVNETNQQRWYKRMYDSLHKTTDRDKDFVTVRYKTRRKGQYPYTSYVGGYASEPERLAGYDSDASISKYATLDRRKIRNKENDFTTSTLPRNRYAPSIKHAVNVYKNQPGRIEDYEPGNSSIAEIEKKQWWDEVLDIFDGELNNSSKDVYATPSRQSFTTYALKDTGYDSDSTLVFKRRENMSENLSPAEQRMAYKVVQSGGEVPLHGLRKSIPDRPKEPIGNPIPTPPRDHASRLQRQESPHRYVESEVNIHYKTPVRSEAKVAWPEDELAEKQAEIMRRIYQEQRRTKYLNELHDMYSRRHTDNLLPSQKSPIPLNRYDDFPLEPQPPRPRDRTPEPKLVARALYNFIGQTSRELSFRRGDIIYVRRQIDKNWYEGEHNAMIGLFPFNYVEIIPYDGIRTLPRKASEGQARAKFNFQAQTHLELSLVKGELVLLTRRVDENWFEGRIGNRKGIFPVSYVEVLVEPGERTLSPSGPVSTKPVVAPASHSVMLNGAKDIGQQHYQPPRPALYSSSSLPHQSKMSDISMVSQSLHIDTQSDPVPYRVLYNYKPQNDDELELKEGDVVYVMEKCDDGWYVGSLHRNGQFGTFPGNYVERILH